jgi:hypothetical protein
MAHQQAPPYGTPAGGGRRAPIGVRGAPTGPRADLSRADTSAGLQAVIPKNHLEEGRFGNRCRPR